MNMFDVFVYLCYNRMLVFFNFGYRNLEISYYNVYSVYDLVIFINIFIFMNIIVSLFK